MKKLSLLVVPLLFAVACKTDKPAPSAAASGDSTSGETSGGRTRSAKIDIKPVGPAVPGAAPTMPAGGSDGREAWRQHRQERLDTNNDGVVSEEERAAAMHERVVSMHARFDTNGDGKLTVEELAGGRGHTRFGDPATLDANRDGDISADELAAAMKAHRAQRDQERAARSAGSAGSAGGAADNSDPE